MGTLFEEIRKAVKSGEVEFNTDTGEIGKIPIAIYNRASDLDMIQKACSGLDGISSAFVPTDTQRAILTKDATLKDV